MITIFSLKPEYKLYTPEQAQIVMRRRMITGYVSLFTGIALITVLALEVFSR